MHITTPEELLQIDLQHLFSIESQLIEALPEFIAIAQSTELKKSLQDHLEETKNQAKRLEEIGEEMDIPVVGETDKGLMNILREETDFLNEVAEPSLKDTALIAGSEKVEHYEMGSYEGAMGLARQLGQDDIADTLQQTFNEEKKSADMLKAIAMGNILGEKVKEKVAKAL